MDGDTVADPSTLVDEELIPNATVKIGIADVRLPAILVTVIDVTPVT